MKIVKALTALTLAMLVACGGGGGSSVSAVSGGGGGSSTPSEPGLEPAPAAPAYWPTTDWSTDTPESRGFVAGAFDNLDADAATDIPFYTSLLVVKDGYLVHESYHDAGSSTNVDASTKHSVWSVTKSIVSLVVGSAVTQGDIDNLDIKVGDMFVPTDSFLVPDDDRNDISLRNVLMMRSGLEWNENKWLMQDFSKDPLWGGTPAVCSSSSVPLTCSILQRPLSYTPGTTWNYNTYDTHLVSAFFTAKTGQTIEDYGNTHLFNYLGINAGDLGWTTAAGTTPQTFGGGLLAIRSRDLIKIGELVLYNGVWDGQTLISPEWMTQGFTSQGNGDVATFGSDNKPSGSHHQAINYAWQWWLRSGTDEAGLGAIVASGLGGQQMHIIRSKGLVVLVTSGFSTQSDLLDPTRQDKVSQFIRTKILAKLNP